MKKHFKDFQHFIESLNFKLNAIYFSETWLKLHKLSDSKFQLPGYQSSHLKLGIFCQEIFQKIQERLPVKLQSI